MLLEDQLAITPVPNLRKAVPMIVSLALVFYSSSSIKFNIIIKIMKKGN